AGAGPVGDVALHEARVGEDVDEDVLRSALLSLVAIVVHVLEVAGGQSRRHDEGGIGVDLEGGQALARRDGRGAHTSSSRGFQAYSVHGCPPVSSSPGKSRKVTSTGIPMRTCPGSTSRSSPSIRTPSSSSTSATTKGTCRPGTLGAWWTTKLNTVPRPEDTT